MTKDDHGFARMAIKSGLIAGQDTYSERGNAGFGIDWK